MTRKQPKIDAIGFVSEVTHDHYRTKNWVLREWGPIIGPYAMFLYDLYSSSANKERGNSWFFPIRTISEFTFFSLPTINMNNWLLEICGLIHIDSGRRGYANEYTVLDPPRCNSETLKPIIKTLETPADVGIEWQRFKLRVLGRIHRWKPLRECGKVSQYRRGFDEVQKQNMFRNNDKQLVARLVETFKDNKPKLTGESAAKMVKQYGAEAIERQLEWLDLREIQDNPLRTLRAALKHDWAEPTPQVVEESWHGGELEPVEPKPVNGNKPPATEPETELQKQWAKVLDIVHIRMTQTTYDNWVKDTELVSIEGDVWMVLCPSEMVKDRLENRLATVMGQCAPKEVQLKFVVNEKSRITLM